MYNTEVVSHQIPVFLLSFLTILFVLSSIHLSNLKKKHWFAFSFYALVSFIMFVDVVYYGYFNALPSVSMLSQVDQITAVGDSIRELLNIKRILFILDLPLICFYILRTQYLFKGKPTKLYTTCTCSYGKHPKQKRFIGSCCQSRIFYLPHYGY